MLDTGSTDVDVTKTNYLSLKPGYHFDGNGLSITLNNTSKTIGTSGNIPKDENDNNIIGQSAPFKIDISGEFTSSQNAYLSEGITIRNLQIVEGFNTE